MRNREHGFFGGERRGYHHGRLKQALVEAARTLVAERGPAGFTLAEAAKLVGVTSAAPYRHFSDRTALMGELARLGFELFAERLSQAWDDAQPDPVAAMLRMGAHNGQAEGQALRQRSPRMIVAFASAYQ